MVVSGDFIATQVQGKLAELGLSGSLDRKSLRYFACYAWAMKEARENFEQFSLVLTTVVNLCMAESEPIREQLLSGFACINKLYPGGIKEPRIAERIKSKGAFKLQLAAKKNSVLLGGGGGRVWAKGIVDELNKGLVRKFHIKGLTDA